MWLKFYTKIVNKLNFEKRESLFALSHPQVDISISKTNFLQKEPIYFSKT